MNKKLLILTVWLFLCFLLIGTNTVSAQYSYEPSYFGFICIIYLIVFIVWLLIGIWVYKDAERRGKSGILWFFVILLLGLIGIIIWLVVRPPIGGDPNQQAGSGRICPDCGRSIPMDARICPYCTKVFHDDHMTQQPTLKYCPHCGSRNKIDATFCEKCGSQI